MGGGLMQLVAYGAQDIYLTGNPQITFFKVVYRRHTNFSMEAIEQTWNGTSVGASGANARCTATISRNGDLVSKMYLEIDIILGATEAVQNPMACAIDSLELEIGGQKIDKHTGQWLNVWSHLSEENPGGNTGASSDNEVQSIGCTNFQRMAGMGGFLTTNVDLKFFVPLRFWFNKNPGLALPLIALQYHEVKVIMEHTFSRVNSAAGTLTNKLWCDYIYLDTDERRRFAQVSHEYLIEQVQETTVTPATSSDLNFNHPVKELIWTVDAPTTGVLQAVGDVTAATGSQGTYQLKLNGHDRFAARDFRYFSRLQIYDYHTGPGGLTAVANNSTTETLSDGIGVYSFALKPEEHQPSGTCNFSRIDNAQLVQGTGATATKVYAVNYNVLRIMSGMGGLAYSN